MAVGTSAAANPPPIPESRRQLIHEAFKIGFRVLHGGRIAYGALLNVQAEQWAADNDIQLRLDRFSEFIRHFSDFSFEALKSLGERLSALHGLAALHPFKAQAAAMNKISLDRLLWREGIAAEKQKPLMHPSVENFEKVMRDRLADWADFDMAAAHYAYEYDFLCTEEQAALAQIRFLVRPTQLTYAASSQLTLFHCWISPLFVGSVFDFLFGVGINRSPSGWSDLVGAR
jgi:hypothetical protein